MQLHSSKKGDVPHTDVSAAIARVVQRARCPNQLEDPAALATAAPGANKRKRCYLPTDILCAAGVRNISAKVVHVHTALCVLVGGFSERRTRTLARTMTQTFTKTLMRTWTYMRTLTWTFTMILTLTLTGTLTWTFTKSLMKTLTWSHMKTLT